MHGAAAANVFFLKLLTYLWFLLKYKVTEASG